MNKYFSFIPDALQGFYRFLKLKHPLLLGLIKNRLPTLSYLKIFQIFFVLKALYTFLQCKGLLPKKSLKNEHVFITGGGMGIGKKVSLILASLGCKITISDINIIEAQKVVDQINKNNANSAQAFECDVSDPQKVKQVAQQCTHGNFGDVTILINNAGIVSGKKLLENSEAMIQKTINVNLVSHHYTVRAFLPKMIEKNRGHIVTIASMAGKMGCAGLVDYCASKFGTIGFDESLRMEMQTQNYNINTTCICPYYINTGMFEGAKSILFPFLDENFVAQRIVDAIGQNETVVMLPWVLGLMYTTTRVLPTSLSDWLMHVTYANRSMDSFKGKQQNTIQQPQNK